MQENNLEQKYPDLKPKWQKRFEFFDTYGLKTTSPEYKEGFKKLSFWERGTINFNFLAFFFTFIYFFIIGLWRKNLVLIGAITAVNFILAIVLTDVSDAHFNKISRTIGFGFSIIYAATANRAYYLHKVKGSKSWNPFE